MHSMFRRYWRSLPKLAATPRTGLRFTSTSFLLRVPPSSAPREVPTPLLFVSAGSWDKESTTGMSFLASMLAEKGFTCIETNLTVPDESNKDSRSMMKDYESELVSAVRLSAIPFPPVIIARASACLIAETYISSNAASGLVLISPPVSNKSLEEKNMIPTSLDEFNYEPSFPIAVIASPQEVEHLRQSNRICQGESVDIISIDAVNDQQTFSELENWLDKLGI